MNKTMIVLVAVSLGALLPAPAQAGQIDLSTVCASEVLDSAGEIGGGAQDALTPFLEATNTAIADVCVSVEPCPEGTYGAVLNGKSTCLRLAVDVPDCVQTKAEQGTAAGSDCPVEPCPAPAYGVVLNGGSFTKINDVCIDGGDSPICVPNGLLSTISSGWENSDDCPADDNETPPAQPKGGSCAASDDGDGWGNPHATCDFPCGFGSELAIGVASSDPTATVYGSVNCGETGGSCRPTPQVCFGASQGPATKADDAGVCDGHADEFWDGPMTVACVASPGADFGDDDPTESGRKLICRYYPDFPTCEDTFAAMSATCIAAHPELLAYGPAVLDGLFPEAFDLLTVQSYVGGVFLPDGSVTSVRYTADERTCEIV